MLSGTSILAFESRIDFGCYLKTGLNNLCLKVNEWMVKKTVEKVMLNEEKNSTFSPQVGYDSELQAHQLTCIQRVFPEKYKTFKCNRLGFSPYGGKYYGEI